ncbi:MAG: CPP1-like family protein [Cyanobacteria bacterium P01_D01_bin.128]
MSDQSYYETLGLDESSSFEDIQAARDRLVARYQEDEQRQRAVEAAYDAILMQRLRLRQEGKIKVPDRIRFAEKVSEPLPSPKSAPVVSGFNAWFGQLFDTPDRRDVWQAALVFGVLAVAGIYAPPLALALGTGSTIYFLNRKGRKLWRSVLITVVALVVGLTLGASIGQFLIPQGFEAEWATPDGLAALVCFFVLWLVSSFLR